MPLHIQLTKISDWDWLATVSISGDGTESTELFPPYTYSMKAFTPGCAVDHLLDFIIRRKFQADHQEQVAIDRFINAT